MANKDIDQQLWDEAEEFSKNEGIITPHRGGWVCGYFFARKNALTEISAKDKEIANLRAWKESAMAHDYNPQRVGKLLGVELGQSIHDKVVQGIERLLAEIAELKAKNNQQ